MVYVWNMYGDVLGACGVSMHVFQTYPRAPMRVLQAPFPRPQQNKHILCAQASQVIVVAFKNASRTYRFQTNTCAGIVLLYRDLHKHLTK